MDLTRQLDTNTGGASNDRLLEKKTHSVIMKLEAAEQYLTSLTNFIKGVA